ncbi:MAG: T9SS type A sorting domain-containing protein [Ignavibacteria bacterium]|nr:T9SS type A sorting domain-containing protein [Ignavibacteria bacterium]
MKIYQKFLLIIFSFFILPFNIVSSQWVQTSGPEGGNILDMNNYNNTVYAITQGGGLFKSNNFGLNWIVINGNLPTNSLYKIYSYNNKLFVSTYSGIYSSIDEGMNWVSSNNGIPSNTRVISFDSENNKLFAGTNGSGLYQSTDDGLSWQNINLPYPNLYINGISTLNNRILIVTEQNGILHSTNSGENWSFINNGMKSVFNFTSSLILNETYFVTNSFSGIFKSTNFGQNWIQIYEGSISDGFNFIINYDSTLYACSKYDVYRSLNMGSNWDLINKPSSFEIIRSLIANNNYLISGTSRGIYQSSDYGLNWSNGNNGLIASNVTVLNVTNNNLFAGNISGKIFSSINSGANWVIVNNSNEYSHFTALETIDGVLYGGNVNIQGYSSGMFKSFDNGANWIPINSGISLSGNPTRIKKKDKYIYTSKYGTGFFRTSNQGNNWQKINNNFIENYIADFCVIDSMFYFATNSGIYSSTNNGLNWNKLNNDNNGIPSMTHLNCVSLKNNKVYTGGFNRIYSSSNFGITWNNIIDTITPGEIKSILFYQNEIILVSDLGVWVSNIHNINWIRKESGLPKFRYLINYAVIDNNFLYISLYHMGVWKIQLNQLINIRLTSNNYPNEFILEQNYPNPFNPKTKIKFSLNRKMFVKLRIFDINGKELITAINKFSLPGEYEYEFDGSNLSSGIYFYILEYGEYSKTKKMVLIK